MSEPFRCELQVRWGDSDRLGHVNNVMYLEYAQEARLRFFRAIFDGTDTGSVGPVVVRRLEVDFERSLTDESDPLSVEVTVTKLGRTSMSIRHRISDRHGVLHSTVDAVLVALDMTTNTPHPISDEARQVLLAHADETLVRAAT